MNERRTWTMETHRLTVHTHPPAGIEEYRTPRGNGPMRPHAVTIEYDLSGKYGPWVRVVGDRLEHEFGRRRVDSMVRRLDGEKLETAPAWVRTLVESHDPGVCCSRVDP